MQPPTPLPPMQPNYTVPLANSQFSMQSSAPIHHTAPIRRPHHNVPPVNPPLTIPTQSQRNIGPSESLQNRNETSSSNIPHQAQRRFTNVCPNYIRGNCEFGTNGRIGGICGFEHPSICKPYISLGNKGCNFGKYCDEYHPDLCWKLLDHGRCNRTDCRYYHVQQRDNNRRSRRSNNENDFGGPRNARIPNDNNLRQNQESGPQQSQSTNHHNFLAMKPLQFLIRQIGEMVEEIRRRTDYLPNPSGQQSY